MQLRIPAWLALAAACLAVRGVSGQETPQPGDPVLRVEVRGLRYHREAAIKALIESREGRRYDKQVISEDVHRLNRTGYFADVRHRAESIAGGVALVFTVVENDRIADVELVGVKQQEPKVLRDSLRLRAGEYYDPFTVKRDIDEIREKYRYKGFHFAEVSASPPQPGPDGVTVRYSVVEGPRVFVEDVRFTGKVTLDPGVLLDKMLMRPPGWLSSTEFVRRTLDEDMERVKNYCRWEGWLDAAVALEDLVFSADKSEVVIVIRVDEGRPYRVRSLSVQGHALFTAAEILDAVSLKPGGRFSVREERASEERLLDKYHERAYILADINVQHVYSLVDAEVDVLFQIQEHGRIFIDRIVIQGNDKTRDVVIRRALGVGPGEEYNKVVLERGIRRLRDLGFFEKVSFREEPGSAPDRRTLVVEVKEASTGAVRFAGGYSSHFGVVGRIELTQRNFDLARAGNPFDGESFSGAGQFFQLEFMPGARRTGFSVTFAEPYLFQEPIGFSARGFRTQVRRIFEYLEDRWGGSIGLDRRFLDERLKLGLRWRFENIDISDLDIDASPDAREVEGLNILRTVTPLAAWDTRDSILQPTEGVSATASTEVAGHAMGGDYNYTKTRVDMDYHLPVYTTLQKARHVLSLGGTFGWMGPNRRDSDVPLFERFFAGGGGAGGLRGFSFRRVGPTVEDDPVGGRALLLGQVEYGFPLYEQVFRGAAFVDAGDLEPSIRDLAADQMRISTGVGLRMSIPAFGGGAPLALYYGVPIRRETGDRRRSIFFDIGFPF